MQRENMKGPMSFAPGSDSNPMSIPDNRNVHATQKIVQPIIFMFFYINDIFLFLGLTKK